MADGVTLSHAGEKRAPKLDGSQARNETHASFEVGAIVTNPRGIIAEMSYGVAVSIGVPQDSSMRRSLRDWLPAQNANDFDRCVEEMAKGAPAFQFKTLLGNRSDSIDVLVIRRPADGTDGEPELLWILPGIGCCQQLERERKVSADRLEAVLDCTDNGIIVIDDKGIIESVNHSALRMFGYEAGEMIGKNVKLLVPDAHRDKHDGYLAEYLRTGHSSVIGAGREAMARRKNGAEFAIHLLVREFAFDHSRRFSAVVRDLEELRRAQDRAVQAERMAAIGETMSALTHESRNALQRGQASLSLLARRLKDSPEALQLLDELKKSQDDLQQLYEEVRRYSSPVQVQPRWCDLGEILDEAWEQLAADRAGRDATLRQFAGSLELLALVGRYSLHQALRNILENSLTATPDPVRIEADWKATALDGRAALRLTVRDNGPGFPDESRRKAFKQLFTSKSKGAGFGLAIAKRVVDAHGGLIALGPGPGAEIVIILPKGER